MTYEATGNCFEAAARVIVDRCLLPPKGRREKLVLVHGFVMGEGPLEGIRHWHAWLETPDGRTVLDVTNGRNWVAHAKAYYAQGQIEKTFRYQPEEVRQLLLRHEHWGPWEQEALDHVPGKD